MTSIITSVLIVDDLAENLLALDALLRQPGLQVLQARSGQQALELLLVHDVALAIVDVQMPGMNGFELAELMRGTERTRRVPIIFVTAGVTNQQRRFRGYEAGAVDFLSKPIEADVLRSKAEVFFELYRQRQEVAQQRDGLKAATERIEGLLLESQAQSRALREADQRKDEFLATLAHELRNPLAPIRNAIEILRLGTLEESELRQPIEIAARQVRHMSRLIDDLLDVARIANGKIELRLEPCELVGIVRDTAEDYRPTFVNCGVDLVLRLPDEEFLIQADATRVAQMFGNLLHNAQKFTARGGRVEVALAREGEMARLSVADSGVGFDPADVKRLFEVFGQAHATGGHRSGGLGLGLALTKGFVELHGGTVGASSPGLGYGATFWLELPLTTPKRDNSVAEQDADEAAPTGLSILLVEDNLDSAASLKMLLTLLGHQVAVAHRGDRGVALARESRPQVIISDLGLPGALDGYGLAREVRGVSELSATRLIALSGFGMEEDKRRAQEAGFNHHLTKPVSIDDLRAALRAEA